VLCSQCKAQIPEDSVFCPNCGARQETPVPAAAGPPSEASGGPVRVRSSSPTTPRAPSRSRHLGVALVSGSLWVLGWLLAIAGLFVAIGAATREEFLIELSAAQRLGIFVGTLIVFWLLAVIVLWFAYVLRLLSNIERAVVGGESVASRERRTVE
jgi:hypothetical protein